MIIKPKFRGFICTTSHPEGCKKNVENQINYVESNEKIKGIKNVLVLGASTGYGLASSIVSAVACDANVLAVSFEREGTEKRTASSGWYNIEALKSLLAEKKSQVLSINGDAFSLEIKEEAIEKIKEYMGKVDLVIYSLAAPKRTNPLTKETLSSCLKTIGEPFSNKTVNFHTGEISNITIPAATEEEIKGTVGVMGGEDWMLWIKALKEAKVLSEGVKTIAYSYIGPEVTYPIYREGTIGKAKEHLEKTAKEITEYLKNIKGQGIISVNKALVTQASSAIPIVPLYVAILYKLMIERGTHEGCIEQIYRLFNGVYGNKNLVKDSEERLKLDDYEMDEELQNEIVHIWEKINTDNINDLSYINLIREEFFKLFGFGVDEVDYNKDINPRIV
ncbi:enoyl-ACP reductase FabV [Clostridium tarantellae]|uniref:Trans-2-enoyl-CoA reductase [NADH] n=1 Tax=Clostridium tarantellae TaxID=39493 RepID=A0A6I1MPU2_9CLOT|nr:enoyl-ACP reductase FabV [Clostridium tarantellae]MPQ42309.1 enoyl-[acyl-carrier-protein] reductase FabV [Clostridium tarantellae]